jgi:hypothetical protein
MSYISGLHLTSKNKHEFSCERKVVILRWRERVRNIWLTSERFKNELILMLEEDMCIQT